MKLQIAYCTLQTSGLTCTESGPTSTWWLTPLECSGWSPAAVSLPHSQTVQQFLLLPTSFLTMSYFRSVCPTGYSLALRGVSEAYMRYWQFEGSDDNSQWTILSRHDNDTSLSMRCFCWFGAAVGQIWNATAKSGLVLPMQRTIMGKYSPAYMPVKTTSGKSNDRSKQPVPLALSFAG